MKLNWERIQDILKTNEVLFHNKTPFGDADLVESIRNMHDNLNGSKLHLQKKTSGLNNLFVCELLNQPLQDKAKQIQSWLKSVGV